MVSVTLRGTKGAPLTHTEMDDNFSGLANAAIPAGGVAGSYLKKLSATDYDTEWEDRVNAATLTTIGKNNSVTTAIPKGTPVYVVSSAGNTPTIAPADAADPTKMPAIGVAGEEIAADAEGVVIVKGFINGVDTSTFTEGDEIYIGSGGGYVNAKPTGANVEIQYLGIVIKVDASNGSGLVLGTSKEDLLKYQDSIFQGWTGSAWQTTTELSSDTTPALKQVLQYSQHTNQ